MEPKKRSNNRQPETNKRKRYKVYGDPDNVGVPIPRTTDWRFGLQDQHIPTDVSKCV